MIYRNKFLITRSQTVSYSLAPSTSPPHVCLRFDCTVHTSVSQIDNTNSICDNANTWQASDHGCSWPCLSALPDQVRSLTVHPRLCFLLVKEPATVSHWFEGPSTCAPRAYVQASVRSYPSEPKVSGSSCPKILISPSLASVCPNCKSH